MKSVHGIHCWTLGGKALFTEPNLVLSPFSMVGLPSLKRFLLKLVDGILLQNNICLVSTGGTVSPG